MRKDKTEEERTTNNVYVESMFDDLRDVFADINRREVYEESIFDDLRDLLDGYIADISKRKDETEEEMTTNNIYQVLADDGTCSNGGGATEVVVPAPASDANDPIEYDNIVEDIKIEPPIRIDNEVIDSMQKRYPRCVLQV